MPRTIVVSRSAGHNGVGAADAPSGVAQRRHRRRRLIDARNRRATRARRLRHRSRESGVQGLHRLITGYRRRAR